MIDVARNANIDITTTINDSNHNNNSKISELFDLNTRMILGEFFSYQLP